MQASTLRNIPLFSQLPEHEIEDLLAISHIHDFSDGEVIFWEDQPSDCFLVILEGQVEVIKSLGTDAERSLGVVDPGGYLGEVGLFQEGQVRSASVRCRGCTRVLELARKDFQALLERRPQMAFLLLQEMSKRLRSSEDATVRDLQIKNLALTQAYDELKAAQANLLAKERLEAELATARRIQESLLPKETPQLSGWQVDAYWQPAREVSGDFYDFLSLPDGRLGLVVGDVSGKGVPAALVMATTRSVLRATLRAMGNAHSPNPGNLLALVNDLLVPDMPPHMFVTCLAIFIDLRTGNLELANAGHCLPYAWGGPAVRELRATGLPLGLLPGVQYDQRPDQLQPGERLLLLSDGLLEAHNPAGQMYGRARIMDFLTALPDRNSAQSIADLRADLMDYCGPLAEQEDDITLLSLGRSI